MDHYRLLHVKVAGVCALRERAGERRVTISSSKVPLYGEYYDTLLFY